MVQYLFNSTAPLIRSTISTQSTPYFCSAYFLNIPFFSGCSCISEFTSKLHKHYSAFNAFLCSFLTKINVRKTKENLNKSCGCLALKNPTDFLFTLLVSPRKRRKRHEKEQEQMCPMHQKSQLSLTIAASVKATSHLLRSFCNIQPLNKGEPEAG